MSSKEVVIYQTHYVKGLKIYKGNFPITLNGYQTCPDLELLRQQKIEKDYILSEQGVLNTQSTWYADNSPAKHRTYLNGLVYQDPTENGAVFDGLTGYITSPNTTDFDFNKDFTIEFYMKPDLSTYSGQYRPIIQMGDGITSTGKKCNWSIYLKPDTLSTLYFSRAIQGNGTKEINLEFSGISLGDAWYHVVFIRKDNYIKLFINGIQQGSSQFCDLSLTKMLNDRYPLTIGKSYFNDEQGFNITNYYKGKLDEIRIVNGTAIYTENFDEPITNFTPVSGTQLLLNFGLSALPTIS